MKKVKNPENHQYDPVVLKVIIVVGILCFCGCSSLMSSAALNLADNLNQAILNHNDLKTVETGAPAYLLLVDSLLQDEPDNARLLQKAASMYTAYAEVFVEDAVRSKKLTDKAFNYASRSICVQKKKACAVKKIPFDQFEQILAQMNTADVPALHTLGTTWAVWIRTHQEDWNAIAEISRVEAIMKRIIELDAHYRDGDAYLYMGVLETLLPPALGGKPENGKQYFDQALAISGKKNFMINVLYARQYARLVFDQTLHDRLLNEVIDANPEVPGYTLMNILAQKQARELLESGKDYF